jgi:hypothetical protein
MSTVFFLVAAGLVFGSARMSAQAETDSTATPVSVSLPQSTVPSVTPSQSTTGVPVTSEAFPQGVLLEAREGAGEVNVREDPDPDARMVGAIRTGTQYPVIARYFRWIQFEFPVSPTSTGWVFDELVTLVGDEAIIPEYEPGTAESTVTDDLSGQTQESYATGTLRELTAPVATSEVTAQQVQSVAVLPTYTYPAGLAQMYQDTRTTQPATEPVNERNSQPPPIAPGVPIVIMVGAGLIILSIQLNRQ